MHTAEEYESVIGLEVHIQLQTISKLFSGESTQFGSVPNSQVGVISLGHPGTLPAVNSRAVEYAVLLGLACHCDLAEETTFSRKHYFYPDLPKGFQTTQDTNPICRGGHITIRLNGTDKKIRLTRIHLEEDAGKSIHDLDPNDSLVDLNRAGVPLLELVSEPDLRSAEEAYQFMNTVHQLVRYLEICDGNMEEGSLRCDCNVSIRKKNHPAYGTRVEIKNLNSFRFVQKAIDSEIARQISILKQGEEIVQETRSFDAASNKTMSLRSKEMAHDYRYLPEPDLLPVPVSEEFVDTIRTRMPALPHDLLLKFIHHYKIPEADARQLTEEKEFAQYYVRLTVSTEFYKAASNWMNGPVKSYLNKERKGMQDFPIAPEYFAKLINLAEDGKVSFSAASQLIFPELLQFPDDDPLKMAIRLNVLQESNESKLTELIQSVIEKNPEKVEEYRRGKKALIGMFMGEIIRASNGKADPEISNRILRKLLDK